ncbi:MAG: hypothetical protein KDI22_07335 [Gammaproteobacteria bacterium]|nr:hypothetical protein [Gammaproteobacteria bacterium]
MHNRPTNMSPLLLCIVLAGCSSSHDLKRDGENLFGGGFADREITPGLYQLTASANTTPLYFGYGLAPEVRQYNTAITGYILCDTSGMGRREGRRECDALVHRGRAVKPAHFRPLQSAETPRMAHTFWRLSKRPS